VSFRRVLRWSPVPLLIAAVLPTGLAEAASNTPPKIVKAQLRDSDGNGLADRITVTYNERIRHKVDTSSFPFRVEGYEISRVGASKGSLTLGIVLVENPDAPAKPASIEYARTRRQPVVDLQGKQAREQMLTRNIIGLNVPPPPPDELTLSTAPVGDGGGRITSSDSRINCGSTCSAEYAKDSQVTLTATPAAGSEFAGWGGAATCSVGSTSCRVRVSTDPTHVTALFNITAPVSHQLAVTKTGLGAVSSTPAGISCAETSAECAAATFPAGAEVRLTAVPGPGMRVKEWTGDCEGGGLTCEITMTGPKVVGLVFELDAVVPTYRGPQT
jgi:hypothetical protein